ncbi:MAG: hypothetical protein ACLR3X_04675 [Intestinibacter bartlettii]
MVELLDKNGILNNKNEFKEILEREELSSTDLEMELRYLVKTSD